MTAFNESHAYLCACEGAPYTADEWDEEVSYLRAELKKAESCWRIAQREGNCLPAKFDRTEASG